MLSSQTILSSGLRGFLGTAVTLRNETLASQTASNNNYSEIFQILKLWVIFKIYLGSWKVNHMSSRAQTVDIFNDLRTKLITAHFQPGDKLKPQDLTELYGCSPNTIRENLFRLSTYGLVTFEEQRGFRVRPASRQRQHDVTEFRILLEQHGVAGSMRLGGIEWEARLTAAHHKLSHIESRIVAAGEIEPFLLPWCAAEWEFHETLVADCGSPVLRETFRSVYDQFRQQHVTQSRNYGYFPGNIAEHQGIVDAALAGDTGACAQAIHDHLARNLSDGS